MTFDVVVVGGGIVGLATALAITELAPERSLCLVEKEPGLGAHQTRHNSGVIHSGVYYRPGSLKAKLTVAGGQALREFCDGAGIRYHPLGKVIVARTEDELPSLEELQRRGVANGLTGLELLDRDGLVAVEPAVAGIAALRVPGVAIVDFHEVAMAMGRLLGERDVTILTSWRLVEAAPSASGVRLRAATGAAISAGLVVNCAGLYADVLARLMGEDPEIQIVPFRGEYRILAPPQARRVRGLVYPVPHPDFPFLGVHLTPTVDGQVEAGPNAVLAFAREGYRPGTIRWRELWETLRYRGFRRLARRHWRMGAAEMWRSLSSGAFAREAARLLPGLRRADLRPGGAGVRAQAVRPDGTLEDDFAFVLGDNAVHVLNAPSPAATASLAIGRHIAATALGDRGGSSPAH